jgi:hypothetical protein
MKKKLKQFTLIYKSGYRESTNHYDIEVVKSLYLNKEVRSLKGKIEFCYNVIEKI